MLFPVLPETQYWAVLDSTHTSDKSPREDCTGWQSTETAVQSGRLLASLRPYAAHAGFFMTIAQEKGHSVCGIVGELCFGLFPKSELRESTF
jgi:hypothetical protein